MMLSQAWRSVFRPRGSTLTRLALICYCQSAARWKDAEEELSADDEFVEAEDQAWKLPLLWGGRTTTVIDGPNGSDIRTDQTKQMALSREPQFARPNHLRKSQFTFAGLSPFSP